MKKAELGETHSQAKKRKHRGPKGPNPLSCMKKKRKLDSDNSNQSDGKKRKRKRHKR